MQTLQAEPVESLERRLVAAMRAADGGSRGGADDGDLSGPTFVAEGAPLPGLPPTACSGGWRQPLPVSRHGVQFEERLRVAVVHPQFDGFLVTGLHARRDIGVLGVHCTGTDTRSITVHHAPGPLWRGQWRPLDLELHPGVLPRRGAVEVQIQAYDGEHPVGQPLRVVLAGSSTINLVQAGTGDEGADPAALHALATALLDDRMSTRRAARALHGGRSATTARRISALFGIRR